MDFNDTIGPRKIMAILLPRKRAQRLIAGRSSDSPRNEYRRRYSTGGRAGVKLTRGNVLPEPDHLQRQRFASRNCSIIDYCTYGWLMAKPTDKFLQSLTEFAPRHRLLDQMRRDGFTNKDQQRQQYRHRIRRR